MSELDRRGFLGVLAAGVVGAGCYGKQKPDPFIGAGGGSETFGSVDSLTIKSGERYLIKSDEVVSYEGIEWEPDAELILEPGAEMQLSAVSV